MGARSLMRFRVLVVAGGAFSFDRSAVSLSNLKIILNLQIFKYSLYSTLGSFYSVAGHLVVTLKSFKVNLLCALLYKNERKRVLLQIW